MFTYLFALLGVLPFYIDQLWLLSFIAFLPLFVNKTFKNFFRFGVIYSFLLLLPFFEAFLLTVENPFFAIPLFGLTVFTFFLIQFGLTWVLTRLGVFLPLSFTIAEVFRSFYPFNGFPYYKLGEVWVNIPFLNLSLHYTTVFGGTFLILFINYLIYKVIENWETHKEKYFGILLTLTGILVVLSFVGWKNLKIPHHGLKIAIVQPFVRQEDKLRNEKFLKIYTTFLVSQVPCNVDLVLLPETALPLKDIKDFVKTFKDLNLIFGTYKVEFDFTKLNLFALNLAVFAERGRIKGIYVKRILVPFGEYTPKGFEFLEKYIPYLANIDYKAGNKTAIFEFKGLKIIPRICNEVFYNFDAGILPGDIVVVLSNDAWFYSPFVKEHLRAVKVRAIETGKVFIFVNNNGWSGIVYPNGTYKGYPFQKIQLLEL
jgi:apolipoprotein N-acyltransferase